MMEVAGSHLRARRPLFAAPVVNRYERLPAVFPAAPIHFG